MIRSFRDHRAAWSFLALGAVLLAALGVRRFGSSRTWSIRNAPPKSREIICFGDSLVAGVGASDFRHSYPGWLQQILGRRVMAFGHPGATAEQAWKHLSELPPVAGTVVIVTLGGNDILRQVPLEQTCRWLERIFTELQRRGAVVVYTGIAGIFSGKRTRCARRLCRRTGVLFVPDVLRGILSRSDLKSDPVHPNDRGYRRMAERVAAVLARRHWRPPTGDASS